MGCEAMDLCVPHMTWSNKSSKPAMSMHSLASEKPWKFLTESILVHINRKNYTKWCSQLSISAIFAAKIRAATVYSQRPIIQHQYLSTRLHQSVFTFVTSAVVLVPQAATRMIMFWSSFALERGMWWQCHAVRP